MEFSSVSSLSKPKSATLHNSPSPTKTLRAAKSCLEKEGGEKRIISNVLYMCMYTCKRVRNMIIVYMYVVNHMINYHMISYHVTDHVTN